MDNESIIGKPYTLRKLCADDIFPMCSILKRTGFKELKSCFDKDTIKNMVNKGEANADVESIGFAIIMDIASIIISNMENCKDSLYQFLSSLTGMSKKEIGELDMDVFFELIIDVMTKDEFKGFIKVASRFMK